MSDSSDETADLVRLADVGEIVGPVTHEVNNFLNSLMLQLAVMELNASDAVQAELQGLKRQGKQVAALVRQMQQYRRGCGTARPSADLGSEAGAAAEAIGRAPTPSDGRPRIRPAAAAASDEVPLRLRLTDGLPAVPGPAADLRRLCRFLVSGVSWSVAGGGVILLSTAPAGDGVALRVEAIGAAAGSLAGMLEGPVNAEGPNGLEIAACQSIVRRLGGSIRAEPTPDGEALVVELPAAG
jgi:signal transduction histidine kinase